MWSGRLVFPSQVLPVNPGVEVEEDDLSDLEEIRPDAGEPTLIPIRILNFQCIDYYTSMLAPPGTTTEEVIAYLNDPILQGDDYWYMRSTHNQMIKWYRW